MMDVPGARVCTLAPTEITLDSGGGPGYSVRASLDPNGWVLVTDWASGSVGAWEVGERAGHENSLVGIINNSNSN